jgi:hypothetical protein
MRQARAYIDHPLSPQGVGSGVILGHRASSRAGPRPCAPSSFTALARRPWRLTYDRVSCQCLWVSSLEQIGMCSCPHEDDALHRSSTFEPVNQEEIPANVAFSMIGPVAGQRVIQPLRPQRTIVGDEQQHHLFESLHIEAAGA